MAGSGHHTGEAATAALARKLKAAEGLLREVTRQVAEISAAMDDLNSAERWRLNHIAQACSDAFGVTPEELTGASRGRLNTRARFAFYYLAERYSRESQATIGRYCSRDRAGVRNGIIKAKRLIETDPDYAAECRRAEALTAQLWEEERAA